uniref:At4G36440-like protein n=1 Tax=Tanacetum cinerariifolium TaxID=118510 RepID=A0A6L2KNY6_TANCI|nr:At4G36440-like protein [Tanacetum cinerariifolium]
MIKIRNTASVVLPPNNCYVVDNSSHIHDFSQWLGHPFEYDGVGTDYAIRFCKYAKVEHDKDMLVLEDIMASILLLGHTAQLNIICGDCPNARCKSGLDCVCKVTSESNCRVIVELAITCEKSGQRVFEGFTVGFHSRSWEVVYNGMTQYGYEKPYKDYSFDMDQSRVSLYMNAIAFVSKLVQKPIVAVSPETGLERRYGDGVLVEPTVVLVDPSSTSIGRTALAVESVFEDGGIKEVNLACLLYTEKDDKLVAMVAWAQEGKGTFSSLAREDGSEDQEAPPFVNHLLLSKTLTKFPGKPLADASADDFLSNDGFCLLELS